MSTLASAVNQFEINPSARPPVLILEAPSGLSRRAWLDDSCKKMGASGAHIFRVSCDFDRGGPWAGINELFSVLLPEIQRKRPDLIERHSLELVYILPELRRTMKVRNPNLTDLATGEERTRNYPVDRAYRNIHGLIDLLDNWKSANWPDTPWVIACDDFDEAGAMSKTFFGQLMRRRWKQLKLRLVIAIAPGKSAVARESFDVSVPVEVVTLDLASFREPLISAAESARSLDELEKKTGDDPLEKRINLCDLIRLSRLAQRPEKLLQYKYFALETYNTAGLYADAIRYSEGVLDLAAAHAPEDGDLRWAIVLKLIMSHLGLDEVEISLRLAEEEGPKLAENHPERGLNLFYLLAMFYARFQKPRDFAKGEEYLERAFEAINQANLSEGDRHFRTVFNMNGLAMIRNFQGRHQEAIELCRAGMERLDAHLGAGGHRLHRSILSYNTAQVYAATGFPEEAIKNYSAAMEMDPNYSEYYNERGNMLLNLGRLAEAKADYLKAIELSPPYCEVFTNLGQCYRQLGAMEDAIESYSRALDFAPEQLLSLLGRAKSHEKLGHTKAAIEDYSAAIALDSTQWEAIASRGVLFYEAGDLDASLSDFDNAILLKQDVSDLYQNRATVLADLGRHREAAEDLKSALVFNPSNDDRALIETRLESVLQPAS